jgi:hypothetical protein
MQHQVVNPQSEAALLEAPEPVFRLSSTCQLQINDQDEATANHLGRKIAAYPGHLLSHTRRVLLARRRADAEELFGALVDLFVATGPLGLDLRRRLLTSTGDLLAPVRRKYLHANLECGLSPVAQVACRAALLTTGTRGIAKAIVRFGVG